MSLGIVKEARFINTKHSTVSIRVANVLGIHNDLSTQSRPLKMSKFHANIFFDMNYFQLLMGLRIFQKSGLLKVNFFRLSMHLTNE